LGDSLDAILGTEILLVSGSPADIDDLIAKLDICHSAKAELVEGRILWTDYLDLIELATDVDEYLNVCEDNATFMGF
jgi:hypothetical protein